MKNQSVGVDQALRRGLRSARANWRLVIVRWLQDLLSFGLAGIGLVLPWLAVFGRDAASDLAPLVRARDVDALAEAVLDVWDVIVSSPEAVTMGVGGLVATWMLALIIYCWAQGGTWGVLAAAEAAAGGGKPAAAFTWRRFARCARRYFWRFFWLINLYATVVLALVFFWLLPQLLVPRAAGGGVSWIAVVVAGLLIIPLGLAVGVAALWYAAARAELGVADTTVKETSRRAWRRLRRSPGTPILVSIMALAAVMVASSLLAPLSGGSLALGGLGGGLTGLVLAAQVVLFGLQALFTGWIATVHSAALVAWAAGSVRREEGA